MNKKYQQLTSWINRFVLIFIITQTQQAMADPLDDAKDLLSILQTRFLERPDVLADIRVNFHEVIQIRERIFKTKARLSAVSRFLQASPPGNSLRIKHEVLALIKELEAYNMQYRQNFKLFENQYPNEYQEALKQYYHVMDDS